MGSGQPSMGGCDHTARDYFMPIQDAGGDYVLAPSALDTEKLACSQFNGGFDYGGLPSNATNELLERRAQIQGATKRTTEIVAAMGNHLIAAKKILGHGRFIEWVDSECGIRIRTAQNYMTISRLLTKYAFVAHLPVGMVLRLSRVRGHREFLDSISANLGRECRLTEDEFSALREKFTRMRQLKPKRRQGRRPNATLRPVERPSQKYRGHTKTEYAKLNADYIRDKFGFLGLYIFKDVVATDTVAETLVFVEAELRRCQFQIELNLRKSCIEEYAR
jgi:hypothetical protein